VVDNMLADVRCHSRFVVYVGVQPIPLGFIFAHLCVAELESNESRRGTKAQLQRATMNHEP